MHVIEKPVCPIPSFTTTYFSNYIVPESLEILHLDGIEAGGGRGGDGNKFVHKPIRFQ